MDSGLVGWLGRLVREPDRVASTHPPIRPPTRPRPVRPSTCPSQAVDFAVREIENLEHEDLASRACLQCLPRDVDRLQVPPARPRSAGCSPTHPGCSPTHPGCSPVSLRPLPRGCQVPPEAITLVRTMDCAAVPFALHAQLLASLPGAKFAPLKRGADLPHLGAPAPPQPAHATRRSAACSVPMQLRVHPRVSRLRPCEAAAL